MPPLEIRLATGNQQKIQRLNESGIPAKSLTPLFDEEAIKEELSLLTLDAYQYVTKISRRKFLQQKETLIDTEHPNTDYVVMLSDSVVALGKDYSVPLNRDGIVNQDRIIEQINNDGQITYLGALTFGRLRGQGLFTVLSYLQADLAKKISQVPVPVDSLSDLVGENSFKAGFIEYQLIENQLVPSHKLVVENNSLPKTRSFISGLVPDVIALASEYGEMDFKVGSVVSDLVAKHPFNTLSFYCGDKPDYQSITDNRQAFFNQHGGNCSFISLALIDQLRTLGFPDAKMVLYPTTRPQASKGHSAVIVPQHQFMAFFDPGLSIPFMIPFNPDIPLVPILAGDNKHVLLTISNQNSDFTPDLTIEKPGGRIVNFQGINCLSPREFTDQMPEILEDLHDRRKIVKIDFHDQDGNKTLGLSLNRESRMIQIQATNLIEVLLSVLLNNVDLQMQLEKYCSEKNIDFQSLLLQLKSYRD